MKADNFKKHLENGLKGDALVRVGVHFFPVTLYTKYFLILEDTVSYLSDSDEERHIEVDSVIQNMKDRRKASGQEVADIKLR